MAQAEETSPHELRPGAAGEEHTSPHEGAAAPGNDTPGAHEVGEHAAAGAHAPTGEHAAAGAHASGEHGAHGAHELQPINWFDFSNHEQLPYAAALLNFVVLLAIYVTLGKKPIAAALQKRKKDIAQDIEEASRLKREAEERAKKYQADLANLDQDLEVARQALVEAGKKERERIVADAKERATRMKRDADQLLELEAKQKQHDLTLETIEAATVAAEAMLKAKLTQEDHLRLAEEFLAELGQKPAASLAAQGA